MKNVNVILGLAFSSAMMISCAAEEQNIDAKTIVKEEVVQSTAEFDSNEFLVWTGYKVVGSKHQGTLAIKSHDLQFDNGILKGGEIIVDMTSLKNTDLEGEWKDKLEAHLTSDDFFSTSTYPTAKMQIVKVTAGEKSGEYKVEANVTIKKTTLVENFTVVTAKSGNQLSLTAKFELDRTKYDVKYGSSNFFENLGDKAIGDTFTIEVNLVSEI